MNTYIPLLTCKICNKKFKEITNTHLFKHGIDCAEYIKKFPGSELKNKEINKIRVRNVKGKTYNEIYGDKRANELKQHRSQCAKGQMTNIDQITSRKQSTKEWWDNLSEDDLILHKEKMRVITTNNNGERKETCNRLYGVPYGFFLSGKQSKSALEFIKTFIIENNIPDSECYYHEGGKTGKEYFINTGKNFFKYDFVWKIDNQIKIAIEYNGPFHVYDWEYNQFPNDKKTPISSRNNKDQYEYDQVKIDTMKLQAEYILIYWQTEKILEIHNNNNIFKIKL